MSLEALLISNETSIRLTVFLSVLTAVAVREHLAPRHALSVSIGVRWLNNLGLSGLNSVIVHLLFPTAAVGLAAFCSREGIVDNRLNQMRGRSSAYHAR
ncbi:MAG: hypothetical protein KUG76_03040 [Gammaproteobacteria bacterium]|nr:hypothetical protein [Gammaproteobacteria bacterium]